MWHSYLSHLHYTSSMNLICYVLSYSCYSTNLKHYLHLCLSRIISWYCSKVNTILTSKELYTKVFFTLTHLYERELLEFMYSLLFSLQFQIYILSEFPLLLLTDTHSLILYVELFLIFYQYLLASVRIFV